MSLRTSRNAWGRSLAEDVSAAMEWELGSRVMNDMEAENTPYVRHGALSARIQRAQPQPVDESAAADQFMECLITVKGGDPEELLFVYDISADNDLMCTVVEPPMGENMHEMRLVSPTAVEDCVKWDKVETGGSEDARK